MSIPNLPLGTLAANASAQGKPFETPLSASNLYLAYLSKADLNREVGLYDILFEVVPIEWAVNVLVVGSAATEYPAPVGPASLYSMRGMSPKALLAALGLKSDDDLAEGSWYVLELNKVQEKPPELVGDLYDPDIDLIPS